METTKPTRILLTGASGYLGQHLLRYLCAEPPSDDDRGYDIIAAYGSLHTFESDFRASALANRNLERVTVRLVGGMDLSDGPGLRRMVADNGPFDVVVNLAAISSPAACQKDEEGAKAVNIPTALLDALSSSSSDDVDASPIVFVHLSTDQVYDGARAPYREDDFAEPINVYGETKLAFERELLSRRDLHAVALRSSLILGPETPLRCRKQTFLQFVRDRLGEKMETSFYTDEYRSVVFVGDVVKVIRHFIDQGVGMGRAGVYNMGGADRVSRMDVAKAVSRHCVLDISSAKGVARASLPPGAVPSPLDISMDITKLSTTTRVVMKGLEEMVKECFP